LLLIFKTNK